MPSDAVYILAFPRCGEVGVGHDHVFSNSVSPSPPLIVIVTCIILILYSRISYMLDGEMRASWWCFKF